MMKRFTVIMILLAMLISPSYAADDDSTPYMPYPEQTQTPKPEPKKKTPVKKSTTARKKTPAKKPAPKKPATQKKTPAKSNASLQQAITLINQGRYNEAKNYLLSAINADKNDANVWYWYGVWHEKLGCFHEAQYFYTKALKLNPSLEPLSRVVYYPDDPGKIPLWDPKRPARVYPVETGDSNFTTVPPFARDSSTFPNAPDDPVIPRVPVYTPPQPGSTPVEGDSWSPAVYVPPSPNNSYVREGTSTVYVPPQIPTEPERRETANIVRTDLPLYTPPEPTQNVTPPPAPKTPEQPKKSSGSTQTKKQPAVPRKVVRQNKNTGTKTSQPKTPASRQNQNTNTNRSTQTQRQTTPARPSSPDVRPVQPVRPSQPQTQIQTPQQPQRQPEVPQRQPERQTEPQRQAPRQEYLPPVGQYAPDPGTVSENPIPPVGQGNQY